MAVSGMEYFIDDDPGYGNGTPVEILSPDRHLIADFVVDLDGLIDGDHVIYMRSKDKMGCWGPVYAHAFSMTSRIKNNKEVVSWFRMYPNPEQGTVSMDFSDRQPGRLTIMINDMNGQTVYSNPLYDNNNILNVKLTAGTYRITVKAGNNFFKQKLEIR